MLGTTKGCGGRRVAQPRVGKSGPGRESVMRVDSHFEEINKISHLERTLVSVS